MRDDFPQLAHNPSLIYLDTAATALKPKCVIDALQDFYSHSYGTVHRAVYDLSAKATHRYEEVREQVAKFLNAAHPEEIIFTRGTTDAINLACYSFGETFLREGDEILITEMEHHSNIIPWQLFCERKNVRLRYIPVDQEGRLMLQEAEKLLTRRTKILALTHVSNVTGIMNPIAEIVTLAKAHGAAVLLDGAQSAPHHNIDVQKLGVDFFAFSGHKAFGPTGIGILYGKKELLEKMAPYQGGGDMIDQVFLDSPSTFQMPPLKFEAGTPMIAEVIGLGAALKWIETQGKDRIAAHEKMLTRYALDKLREHQGIKILGPINREGALISFTLEGMHPLDLGVLLNLKGIALRTGHLCAQPYLRHFGHRAVSRISFGPYNTLQEIDQFIRSLGLIWPI